MKKILQAIVALASFGLAVAYVNVHPKESDEAVSPPTTAAITVRVPGSEIPPKIVSVVITVRHQECVWKDSVITAMIEVDTAQLTVRLPAGVWEMSVRGKERGGIVRYAGLYHVEIGEGEQRTATVRFNQIAKETGKPELGLEWGSEPRVWKMSLNNPVIQADEGGSAGEPNVFASPTVLRLKDGYMLWCSTGYSEYHSGIDSVWTSCATSSDGERWRALRPVRTQNGLPRWAPKSFLILGVLFEHERYRAWFVGLTSHWRGTGIGYAESRDGLTWKLDKDPVVGPSKQKPIIGEASVFKHAKTYYLFYSVFRAEQESMIREIWASTSTDGSHWDDQGRVLKGRAELPWENRGVSKPAVFFFNDQFYMYYTATSVGTTGIGTTSIGTAQSADGIHWNFLDDEPVLTSDRTAPWKTSMISNPTIDVLGDRLTMWFGAYSSELNRWAIGKTERTLSARPFKQRND